jgi:hypothetical protein
MLEWPMASAWQCLEARDVLERGEPHLIEPGAIGGAGSEPDTS